MTRPELGRLGVWGHLDSLPIDAARAFARRAEDLGYGALWVPETVGREPFTLLGLLAGSTERMVLGTSVVGIWGHDPQTTRIAAETLSEATAGRFVLGLGVSHPHMSERLHGQAFDRPLTRMREYLAAYRSAVYRGPGAGGEQAPVLVAALRERMVDLAATDAGGAFPYLVTPERVAWIRARLDAAAPDRRPILAVTLPVALDGSEAARAYLKPYLRTPTYQASWELQGFAAVDWEAPGSDRLVGEMVVTGSADAARARVAELHAAGADHVAIIPLDADGTTESLPVLEAVASG